MLKRMWINDHAPIMTHVYTSALVRCSSNSASLKWPFNPGYNPSARSTKHCTMRRDREQVMYPELDTHSLKDASVHKYQYAPEVSPHAATPDSQGHQPAWTSSREVSELQEMLPVRIDECALSIKCRGYSCASHTKYHKTAMSHSGVSLTGPAICVMALPFESSSDETQRKMAMHRHEPNKT